MMEQEAIVSRIEECHAYVEICEDGGCGHCHEVGGCKSGILIQLFNDKPRQFRIINRIGARQGERVIVRIAEGATLRAALLTYLVPVLFLLLGGALGKTMMEGGDGATALGALGGFALGVLAGLTLRRTRLAPVADPVLVKIDATHSPSRESCQ